MLIYKACVDLAGAKCATTNEIVKKANIGANAADAVIAKRALQTRQRAFAITVPNDQFGDHRIVVDTNFVAFDNPAIDPHMRALGGRQQLL